jgi:hypothetical protein
MSRRSQCGLCRIFVVPQLSIALDAVRQASLAAAACCWPLQLPHVSVIQPRIAAAARVEVVRFTLRSPLVWSSALPLVPVSVRSRSISPM